MSSSVWTVLLTGNNKVRITDRSHHQIIWIPARGRKKYKNLLFTSRTNNSVVVLFEWRELFFIPFYFYALCSIFFFSLFPGPKKMPIEKKNPSPFSSLRKTNDKRRQQRTNVSGIFSVRLPRTFFLWFYLTIYYLRRRRKKKRFQSGFFGYKSTPRLWNVQRLNEVGHHKTEFKCDNK